MKTCLQCHAENPDDARYCQKCRFALDWLQAEPAAGPGDPDTRVLVPLAVALEPDVVRVEPSESAQVRVRVRNDADGDVEATLRVSGAPADYATLDPVTIHLQAGEEALALLEIGAPRDAGRRIEYSIVADALDGRAVSGRARGCLETAGAGRRQTYGRPRPWLWLAPVGALAAILLALVLFTGDGGSDGGGSGGGSDDGGGEDVVSGRARRSSAVREEAAITGARVRPGLPSGSSVRVRCVATGPGPSGATDRWFELVAPPDRVEGKFTHSSNLSLDAEPPSC